jgi:hypothetical protein
VPEFDPSNWTDDFDDLRSVKGRLMDDPDLCDRTFYSKQEAFQAGLTLALESDGAASAG